MFEINLCQLDYLTLTTYNPKSASLMYEWSKSIGTNLTEAKRMQYAGLITSDRYGTSFCGQGVQGTRQHHLLQVSGSLAESAWNKFKTHIRTKKMRVTRIDMQVTVEYDRENHSQSEVADTLRRLNGNKSVSYIESKSGPQGTKLATVYYGSRSSDKYCRIYEKMGMGDEVLLRFEMEYKGKRAEAAAANLLKRASVRSILYGEFMTIPKTGYLELWFDKILVCDPTYCRVVKPPTKTEKWLMGTVSNSLNRFLQQHESDSESMAEHFAMIIAPYLTDEPRLL